MAMDPDRFDRIGLLRVTMARLAAAAARMARRVSTLGRASIAKAVQGRKGWLGRHAEPLQPLTCR